MLFPMNAVFFFISYMAAFYILGASELHPVLFYGVYLFPASLALTWGHKRVARERAGSDFSKVFWTLATTHYLVVAAAFFSYGFAYDPAPVDPEPRQSHGFGLLIVALVIFVLPSILSLPPFVFTVLQRMKGRRQLTA